MPGILWDELDLVTMARLSVEIIREEPAPRQLGTVRTRGGLIHQFGADIKARCELSPHPTPAVGSPILSLYPVTLQKHYGFVAKLASPVSYGDYPTGLVLVRSTLQRFPSPKRSSVVGRRLLHPATGLLGRCHKSS